MEHQQPLRGVEVMPSPVSFEPIGYSTRPDEATIPDDYNERQARRLLARRNAITGIPRQPRVRQPLIPAAAMPPPTGDLFRNTSLEEPANSRAAFAPAPFPSYEVTEAEMEAQNRHHSALVRQDNMTRQRNLDQARAARANRYADRLDAVRVSEKEVLAVFKHALTEWKETKPNEITSFLQHYQNASTAASSSARIWDIVSWFPGTPKQVGMALRAVQKHYHLEAAAQAELRRIEEKCEGWSSREDLDEEVLTTAENDKALQQMGGQGNRAIFGLNVHFADIASFTDRWNEPGQGKERLLNILANLEIREFLLQNSVAHMPKVKPRFSCTLLVAFKFVDSIDCDMIHWCCTAIDVIQYQIKPTLTEGSKLWKLAKHVHDSILSFVTPLDTINLRQTITEVEAELLRLVKEINWSTRVAEGYNSVDSSKIAQIHIDAKDLSDKMLQYEEEHGEGIFETPWKPMVEKLMGGLGHRVDGSGSSLEI